MAVPSYLFEYLDPVLVNAPRWIITHYINHVFPCPKLHIYYIQVLLVADYLGAQLGV